MDAVRGLRITWHRAHANVADQVVQCWTMDVDGDSRAVVFPRDDGTWAVQEEAGGTVVAVRPDLDAAQDAAVAWIEGWREVSRVMRQARRGQSG